MSFVRDTLPSKMNLLYMYALRIERAKEAAEELVAQTLLTVLRREHSYRNQTNFNGWLWTVMKNVKRDMYRKQVRQQIASLDALGGKFEPWYETEESELTGTIMELVNRLSDEKRRVFELVCLDGLTYKEASVRLGVPLGTVMSRLSRAREKIRKGLADVGIYSPDSGSEVSVAEEE